MKKKPITLEEVLQLRSCGEKIYLDFDKEHYYGFASGYLCQFLCSTNELLAINVDIFSIEKPYILEQEEEFKVEKTGKHMTRDGRVAWVSYVDPTFGTAYGCLNGFNELCRWNKDGSVHNRDKCVDLVEYVGD